MKSKTGSVTRRRSGGTPRGNSGGIITAASFGACAGIISAVILLLLCTFICLPSEAPERLITPLAVISALIVYFLTGFCSAKKNSAVIPCGVLSGAVVTVIFFVLSLFLKKELSANLTLFVSLLIRLSFIALSVIGALLGVNTRTKKRKRR